MSREPYANTAYYSNVYRGTMIPAEKQDASLLQASKHIDSLTYNRIVGRGIESLTLFQQEVIQETCCRLADFEYDNKDMLESYLKSYAINGVTMSFGDSWNLAISNGVAIPRSMMDYLSQSGLCCRRL